MTSRFIKLFAHASNIQNLNTKIQRQKNRKKAEPSRPIFMTLPQMPK